MQIDSISSRLQQVDEYIKTKATERLMLRARREAISKKAAGIEEIIQENEYIQIIYKQASLRAKLSVKNAIEELVSHALNIVFGGNHKFIIDMVERRNQFELDFYIDDGYVKIHVKKPFAGKGGSKVSLASIAIKLALVVQTNTTGILCLDEITKMVDNESRPNVVYFIKEFAETFSKQVIFITQDHELAEVADNVLFIDKVNGQAIVTSGGTCQRENMEESLNYMLESRDTLDI